MGCRKVANKRVLLEINKALQQAEYVVFDTATGEMLGIETVSFHDLLLNKTKHDRELYQAGKLKLDGIESQALANVPPDIMGKALVEQWSEKDLKKKFIDNPDYRKFRIDR